MPHQREAPLEDSGIHVISVFTRATLPVNVGVQRIRVDGRIIDNAKQRTIALSVGTLDTSCGNVRFGSSLMLMLGRVRGRPIARREVCPYDLAHKLLRAHSSLHKGTAGWTWAKMFSGHWGNGFFSKKGIDQWSFEVMLFEGARDWRAGHSGAGDERDWCSAREREYITSVSGHQLLLLILSRFLKIRRRDCWHREREALLAYGWNPDLLLVWTS